MKLIFIGLIRGGIPFILLGTVAVLLGFQNKTMEARGTFFTALIVFIVGASSIIYDIPQWGLVKRSTFHFMLMLITIYPILLFSGWFPLHTFKDGLIVLGIFLLVGLFLWTLFFTLATIFKW